MIHIKTFLQSLLLLLLIGCGAAKAQDVGITTQLNKGEIKIGEQAVIDITIRTSDLPNTLLIVPADTAFHQAEALALAIKDTIDVSPTVKEIKAQMLITSFDSTMLTIPPFGVKVGDVQRFAKPLYLKVVMPKVDVQKPDKFFGNKKQWAVPYTFKEIVGLILPWLAGVLVLLLLWWLWSYYRKHRKPRSKEKVLPALQLTPIEQLTQSLSSLPQATPSRLYYIALDEALRTFLARTTMPNAMESNSLEVGSYISQQKHLYPQLSSLLLDALLIHTQLAKYARMEYGSLEAEQDARTVEQIATALWQHMQAKEAESKQLTNDEASQERSETV